MMETDVCVVGAGVMGSAAAHWLSKTPGLKIVLMDRYGISNEFCSSNDANRVFRYAYGRDAFYTHMAVESLRLWKDLETETGEKLLVPSGLLLLHGEDQEASSFNEDSYKTLKQLGLGAEKIDGPDLKRRFPQFSAQDAYMDPHGGVLLASKILSALGHSARGQGVRILEKCQATRLSFKNRPEIETSAGETISCRKVIVTIGAWSNSLRRKELPPITPTRQQTVYFRSLNCLERFRPPGFPCFFADQYYGIPAVGIEGVKVSHKNLWDPVDPDQANRSADSAAVEACRNLCARFIPDLARGEVVRTKVCFYDITRNSDFVLGQDPESPSIIYGYGFSGHGFKFAPLIGKLLAELALDMPASFNIERLSPSKTHEAPVFGPPY